VVAKDLERILYGALVLEDEARKAAPLGEVGTIGADRDGHCAFQLTAPS